LVSQKDPSVIVGSQADIQVTETAKQEATQKAANEATTEAADASGAKNIQDFFSIHPPKLIEEYKANRKDRKVQRKLFDHTTNFAVQSHWDSKKPVEPSPYLDARMSDDQKVLLCPTYKDCLMGFILYDVKGKGAKTKMAKRRLDMITGNVSLFQVFE